MPVPSMLQLQSGLNFPAESCFTDWTGNGKTPDEQCRKMDEQGQLWMNNAGK